MWHPPRPGCPQAPGCGIRLPFTVRHTSVMASPFLYFADDRLSTAELSAACLDGDLVELGDAYIPADAVETQALRAGSLARILGDTLAATHLSAAWIHGALPEPPARHTVQRAVPRRLHRRPASAAGLSRSRRRRRGSAADRRRARDEPRTRTLADLARVGESSTRGRRACSPRRIRMPPRARSRGSRRGVLPHKRAGARAACARSSRGLRRTSRGRRRRPRRCVARR